jgi:hypothetical protein
MTQIRVRQRADEFADAVDGRADDSSVRFALRPLLEVAATLRQQEEVEPRREAAADLRASLVAEAERLLDPHNKALALPERRRRGHDRRMVAIAASVFLVAGTAGVANAAQSALPGQPLYPVKRGIERVQAQLSMSTGGKGRDLLQQATHRVNEATALLQDDPAGNGDQVRDSLREFSAEAQQGTRLVLSSYQVNRDAGTVVKVRDWAREEVHGLQRLTAATPSQAREALTHAAVTLQDIDRRAYVACRTCVDRPPLKVPPVFRASEEAKRALARIHGLPLDNSHPLVDGSDPSGQGQDSLGAPPPLAPPTPSANAAEAIDDSGAVPGAGAPAGGAQ